MKKLLLIITVFLSLETFSQDYNPNLYYRKLSYKIDKPIDAYLFGNNVRIRNEPSTTSSELTKLPINSKITILEKTELTYNINGFNANWVKISYNGLEGYILDNFISLASEITEHSSLLISLKRKKGSTYVVLRYYDFTTKEFNESEYRMEHGNVSFSFCENINLKNIDHVLKVDYHSEACGMEGGKDLIFIQESNIIEIIQLSEASDSGVVWIKQDIEFPNAKNKLDNKTIIFHEETGKLIDESSNWYEKKIIERRHRLINNTFTPELKSKL